MISLLIGLIVAWLTIWACFAALFAVCGCAYALVATREGLILLGIALIVSVLSIAFAPYTLMTDVLGATIALVGTTALICVGYGCFDSYKIIFTSGIVGIFYSFLSLFDTKPGHSHLVVPLATAFILIAAYLASRIKQAQAEMA
jgi:hypothetical protein